MPKVDPYTILGISSESSDEEIKKHYKKKALKYHPDKITDNTKKSKYEKKFKLITEAYEEIKNLREKKQIQPINPLLDNMFSKINTFNSIENELENRMQNLQKHFGNLSTNDKGNFYSRSIMISNINGKQFKKVHENINGNIHQYEELKT